MQSHAPPLLRATPLLSAPAPSQRRAPWEALHGAPFTYLAVRLQSKAKRFPFRYIWLSVR
jgi:hypothetical protein